MDDKKLLALYGLKWNPFQPALPVEALWTPPGLDSFFFRLENLVMSGGFALIAGDPGLGKSKTLQIISKRLSRLEDVVVGVMERPQSSLADFYREMGALFGVNLSPANRYGGFKALRDRWQAHIQSTLFRPVLLIDEAQEMVPSSLNELRLLSSHSFDSQSLLTIVLCGDMRLPERFRSSSLLSLGTRIRLETPARTPLRRGAHRLSGPQPRSGRSSTPDELLSEAYPVRSRLRKPPTPQLHGRGASAQGRRA